MDHEEQLAAQVIAEAEDIVAGRGPGVRRLPLRIHRSGTVDFSLIDRSYTSSFAIGYAQAVAWFDDGAPTIEAKELASLYRDSLPGGPAEDANTWLNAALVPNLIARFGDEFTVYDGDGIKAERIAEYGAAWQDVQLPKRTICWPGCNPWHDGFLLAVHHVMEV